MTHDTEFAELRQEAIERMVEYAECSSETADKMLDLFAPVFISEGAMLYRILDRLNTKGF